jgi:hypothetical protein
MKTIHSNRSQLLRNNFLRVYIKVLRKMELEMVLELSFINKAESMKDIGIIIKWMDMGHYTIQMDE